MTQLALLAVTLLAGLTSYRVFVLTARVKALEEGKASLLVAMERAESILGRTLDREDREP